MGILVVPEYPTLTYYNRLNYPWMGLFVIINSYRGQSYLSIQVDNHRSTCQLHQHKTHCSGIRDRDSHQCSSHSDHLQTQPDMYNWKENDYSTSIFGHSRRKLIIQYNTTVFGIPCNQRPTQPSIPSASELFHTGLYSLQLARLTFLPRSTLLPRSKFLPRSIFIQRSNRFMRTIPYKITVPPTIKNYF